MDRFQVVESFVRVAHGGSFTKAAMQLGLSRALISRRIMDLEARLGVRLLNRSTRSVSLTEEGSAYLVHCEQLLNDMETAEREIARSGKAPLGTIRVLAPKSFGVVCQSDAVIAFSRSTRRSAFRFRSATSRSVQEISWRTVSTSRSGSLTFAIHR
jgi:DNA-binding transcriptional LysR family regulator